MSYARLKNSPILYDDEFVLAMGEQLRQSLIALADVGPLFIGGSRSIGIEGNSRQDAVNFLNFPIDGTVNAGMSYYVHVEVMTADAGTEVQPVLRDIDTGTDLWAGTASAAGTWSEQISAALTLPLAERRYRLQVIKSNADAVVYAIGFLRRRG